MIATWGWRPFHRPAPSKPLTAFGRTLPVSAWARKAGIPNRTILDRLQRGWSPERAVSEPIKAKKETTT
jgi:hypothetical protein